MVASSMAKWQLLGVATALVLVIMLFVTNRDRFSSTSENINPRMSRSGSDHEQILPSFKHSSSNEPLRRINRGIAHYTEHFYEKLRELVKRKAEARDPELVQLVRDVLDEPSESPMMKLAHAVRQTPQAAEVLKILKDKRDGFFIECGALDGERSSNTIYLESSFGWTGVLVEMDPYFYTQVLGKARKSWSLNACLSPYDYVIELQFQGSSRGMGKIDVNSPASAQSSGTTAPCFPLETVLLALNRTRVDYFSLDVEGVEIDILRTIPFNRLTIDTFSVEYRHGDGSRKKILEHMNSSGYHLHRDIRYQNAKVTLFVKDFIFVRNGLTVTR